MRGRAEVARNLAGEETARGDIADQPWEQLLVAEQPVQRGIGEQQIDRGRWAPVRDVRLLPLHIGRLAAGMGEHFRRVVDARDLRSEEHTSELQSLMRSSYAVFCL